jgi:hypothetical protein
MRILLVGSKVQNEVDLNITREITELQRRFSAASADPVEFQVLPDITVESLPGELLKCRPDILHIVSHSNHAELTLSDETDSEVRITARMLGVFLPPEHPPQVVYLNSCDSKEIAQELATISPTTVAIGSTAPITNRLARSSAVAFYERVLAGFKLRVAFDTAKNMLEAVSGSAVSMQMFPDCDWANKKIMNPVPTLIAELCKPTPNKKDGHYKFRLGLSGTPSRTKQVIFFTENEDHIEEYDSLEHELSSLARREAETDGILWSTEKPTEDNWSAAKDHRLLAVGARMQVGCFVIESTLCKALENRYRIVGVDVLPAEVMLAIQALSKKNTVDLTAPKPFTSTNARKGGRKKH